MIFLTALIFLGMIFVNAWPHCDDDITGWEYIWVGDAITEIHHTRVEVPKNSTLFEFMQEAAKHGCEFKFEFIDSHVGHNKFITKIGGHEQVPSKNLYWMVYILNKPPNKKKPPGNEDLSPLAAGNLIVEDNKYYLWWLKTVNF